MIRRAHEVHFLAAMQMVYSLLYRSKADKMRATTRELSIGYVAYSPLGCGLPTALLGGRHTDNGGQGSVISELLS